MYRARCPRFRVVAVTHDPVAPAGRGPRPSAPLARIANPAAGYRKKKKKQRTTSPAAPGRTRPAPVSSNPRVRVVDISSGKVTLRLASPSTRCSRPGARSPSSERAASPCVDSAANAIPNTPARLEYGLKAASPARGTGNGPSPARPHVAVRVSQPGFSSRPAPPPRRHVDYHGSDIAVGDPTGAERPRRCPPCSRWFEASPASPAAASQRCPNSSSSSSSPVRQRGHIRTVAPLASAYSPAAEP